MMNGESVATHASMIASICSRQTKLNAGTAYPPWYALANISRVNET